MLRRAALSWWQCASRILCHHANAARRSPQLSSTLGVTQISSRKSMPSQNSPSISYVGSIHDISLLPISYRRRLQLSNISRKVRESVLIEAGYRCAVPTCRTILAIDIHHIVHVKAGGQDSIENLVALCPNCHALHHRGVIPSEAINQWKLNLRVPAKEAINILSRRRRLKILYFISELRSSGNRALKAPAFVEELQRRGHSVEMLWAIVDKIGDVDT